MFTLRKALYPPKLRSWIARILCLSALGLLLLGCEQPKEENQPGCEQSTKGAGKNEDDRKCDNTKTETTTHTSTSTHTGTSTGSYPFPEAPGRVCSVDRFRQVGGDQVLKKVDILFLMDHSGSMQDDWERVANNMQELVKQLPSDIDARYAVVLGDVGAWRGKLYAPVKVPVVLDNKKQSVQEISNNLHKIFVEGMKVSDVGTGEALFNSLYSAVTERARENQKAGFFRPDAALSIIFMSDEQEIGFPFPSVQAPGLPSRCDASTEDGIRKEYYDRKGIDLDVTFHAVRALKGDMPVKTHAFVNITSADLFKRNSKNAKCLYDSLGYGYFEMVAKTKGLLYSIQEDKAEGLARCGRMIKESLEVQHDFKLSQPANKVDPETILAVVDASRTTHSYRADSNIVHLDSAGQANSLVEIGYCEPANGRKDWTLTDFTGSAGQTAVALLWNTSEFATAGKVRWGLSANSLDQELVAPNIATSHNVTVNSLSPNTVYYFQATSWDGYGQVKQSQVLSLRTQPDWSIAGVSGQGSRNSVVVSWQTAQYPTKGYVAYGDAPANLSQQTAETAVANEHSVEITGLHAGSTYYFQCVGRDEFGLEKKSDVAVVQTLTDWGIVGFVGLSSRTTVDLSWKTPELATDGKVLWGVSAGNLDRQAFTGVVTPDHALTITGLVPNTDYYFQAVGVDSFGVEKRSAIIAVRTQIDWNISGFAGIATESSVSLAWNTTEYDTNGKVLWGLSDTALNGVVLDASLGTTHGANVNGLSPDTLYYFQAVSGDNRGIEKRSAVVAIRTKPQAPAPEPLPAWEIANFNGEATTSAVTLTWKTTQYATSGKVMWGASLASLSNEEVGGSAVTSHSATVSGLSANTVYYFQAVSLDDKGQVKQSDVIAVSTLQEAPTEPPPVANWEIKGFDGTTTPVSADLIWQTPGAFTKAVLKVGTDPSDLSLQSVAVSDFAESHLAPVSNLTSNTTYFFQVVATDKSGRTIESVVISKRTKSP